MYRGLIVVSFTNLDSQRQYAQTGFANHVVHRIYTQLILVLCEILHVDSSELWCVQLIST